MSNRNEDPNNGAWKRSEYGFYMVCTYCNINIPLETAKKTGCAKCFALPYKEIEIEDPNTFSTRKELWKKPKIADLSPSKLKILGFYNTGSRHPKAEAHLKLPPIPPKPQGSVRFVCISDVLLKKVNNH